MRLLFTKWCCLFEQNFHIRCNEIKAAYVKSLLLFLSFFLCFCFWFVSVVVVCLFVFVCFLFLFFVFVFLLKEVITAS